jgi:uncharacterized membrane protein
MQNIYLFKIIGIIILGILGFSVAFYIYRKKHAKKKLICPMRSNCDTVIHSDYSRMLGIPVEVLGMIYYAVITIAYVVIAVFNHSGWVSTLSLILIAMSMCSVFVSVYLVSLQAFVLKHWCIWCLTSACISVLIFALSYSYINALLY